MKWVLLCSSREKGNSERACLLRKGNVFFQTNNPFLCHHSARPNWNRNISHLNASRCQTTTSNTIPSWCPPCHLKSLLLYGTIISFAAMDYSYQYRRFDFIMFYSVAMRCNMRFMRMIVLMPCVSCVQISICLTPFTSIRQGSLDADVTGCKWCAHGVYWRRAASLCDWRAVQQVPQTVLRAIVCEGGNRSHQCTEESFVSSTLVWPCCFLRPLSLTLALSFSLSFPLFHPLHLSFFHFYCGVFEVEHTRVTFCVLLWWCNFTTFLPVSVRMCESASIRAFIDALTLRQTVLCVFVIDLIWLCSIVAAFALNEGAGLGLT